MDPQDQEFRSSPDRPLTRREIRARERAQAEAQQRKLADSGRTSPSAAPRPSASPSRPAPTVPPTPAATPRGIDPQQPPEAQPAPPQRDSGSGKTDPADKPSQPPLAVTGSGTLSQAQYSRPRTGRTLADWPAPVPASATHLAVKGAPVYEAEERLAAAFRPPTAAAPKDPAGEARPASGDAAKRTPSNPAPTQPTTAGLSVLKRAQAARAATEASSSVPDSVWDTPAAEGVDGRHRNAALRHQNGTAQAVAEPGLLTSILEPVPEAAPAAAAQQEPTAHESTVHEAVFASAEEVKAPRRRSRQFKALLAMAITLSFIVVACFVGAAVLRPLLGMDKVSDYSGPGTGQVVVTVQPGSGARAVAQDLQQDGVIADVDTFLKAFASTGASLHPGDFTFKKQMKASDAAQVLAGDSSKVIYFALSAGLRVNESLDIIAKSAGVDRKDLDKLNAQPAQFGLPSQAKNLEGYLAPGEYRFPVGTAAKDILTSLVSATLDELKQDGITDPAKQYEVLTVASIVQAEGGQADYGNVAGAIYNRLKPNDQTNGLVQSDATVTYGLGTKTVQLTDAQKADANNAYNTYVHTGLPPGPIGSPGSKAVAAAAHPTPNDYLFWVTVNLDTGETKFAKTYAEHQGYVAQYQQWCTANAGKCQ